MHSVGLDAPKVVPEQRLLVGFCFRPWVPVSVDRDDGVAS